MSNAPRLLAATVLLEIMQNQGSLATCLPRALGQAAPLDRALISQLTYGACRYYPQLDAIAQFLLDRPISKNHQLVYALLIIGLYQLNHMRTPLHASVKSTVDAAKDTGLPWAAPLCNGVLRGFLRLDGKLPEQLTSTPSYQYNHPFWLQAKLANHWPDIWPEIVAANDQKAPLTLRVNQRHHSREEYLQLLLANGMAANLCQFSPWGVQLEQACQVEELPGFAEGWASVQDEAAQLAPLLLQAHQGQRVLDACAAPGGKACHLLEQNDLDLVALEMEPRRIGRLEDNLTRLKLQANIICADANELDSWWNGKPFDRILLDAPCSATGVIRRNPDIKLLRTSDDILLLTQLQGRLLEQLWHTLAPGGILVYATCSVLKQENERVIKRFLAAHTYAREMPIVADWGITTSHGRQLFPQIGGHDGFYYAILEK